MTSIDPSLLLSNKPSTKNTGSSNLGKDEFLKILMTQLQNQDPLNPMEDKEFIAQMAQFSTLEQTTNMASMLEKFINIQTQGDSIIKYSEMIGKRIEWKNSNEETGTGVVKSVKKGDTGFELEIENGSFISVDNIIKVSNADS
ncbi:flagellar hook assembly protein FlgD [Metabacillus halosaccharovorans]|uniref:Flagellar hook assembly protein FlgD n=1 Tax=Metabacillus halosaccharovorans TaxID=930124 RepID=A0ABT3DLB9_9BACI|nr:flagellar hook assembly protein FlgD [Metabacillus halosaccharovorans]MCV9887663.1 flagellar hook assembly protein FlgD [Metabacillus halosaccharovorans]